MLSLEYMISQDALGVGISHSNTSRHRHIHWHTASLMIWWLLSVSHGHIMKRSGWPVCEER